MADFGSSPLTRGKHEYVNQVWAEAGLIPAHAGKTTPGLPPARRVWAHPRSRGENVYTVLIMKLMGGSSPLTRGKLCEEALRVAGGGLIPAHAGKTPTSSQPRTVARAHPRSRGENHGAYFGSSGVPGSSPLTRGKHVDCHTHRPPIRLIPAHAGKTGRCSRPTVDAAAHPRSRGENRALEALRSGMTGSSPLTRGKPLDRALSGKWQGLIPAHAGKTRTASRPASCARAHPRSRGENTVSLSGPSVTAGSSPLTRGKLPAHNPGVSSDRLIPAHAGKTSPDGFV